MNIFKSFLRFEWKRLFSPLYIILAVLYFIIAMYFVDNGVSHLKETIENKKKFVEIEKQKIAQYQYMTQYAGLGFRVYFLPGPLSTFFYNSGLFSEMKANIDVGERLNLYNSFKGKNIFNDRPGVYADFSGFMLLIGTLMLLFYGFDTFRCTGCLKMLSSLAGHRRLYVNLLLARFLLISLFFFIVTLCGILLVLLEGISLPGACLTRMACFFGVWLLISLCFFITGAAAGGLKSKPAGVVVMMVIWVFSVYLLPIAVNKITAERSNHMATNYELELKKLQVVMNFEKKTIKNFGKMKIGEEITPELKAFSESRLNEGIKKISEIENELERSMADNIRFFQILSSFFPSTYFLSVTCEMSGKGFENIMDFFRYVQELKEKFCLFYKERKLNNRDNIVESFIKGDENIHYAQIRLPVGMVWGAVATIIYIVLAFLISFKRYNADLFDIPVEGLKEIEDTGISIKKEHNNAYPIYYRWYAEIIFSLLSGRQRQLTGKGLKGKILLEDNDIVHNAINGDFFYICPRQSIPGDIRAGDLIKLSAGICKFPGDKTADLLNRPEIKATAGKRFMKLEEHEKAEILLALTGVKKSPIYFFHDIAKGLDWDFVIKLSKRMNELTDDGALAFYLTTDEVIKTKKTETKNKEVRITKKIKDWAETAAFRKELYLEENQ